MVGWLFRPQISAAKERGLLDTLHVSWLREEIIRKPLIVLHRLVVDSRDLLSVHEVIDHPRRSHAIDLDKF
jgi:hypothetical protein